MQECLWNAQGQLLCPRQIQQNQQPQQPQQPQPVQKVQQLHKVEHIYAEDYPIEHFAHDSQHTLSRCNEDKE